MSAVRIFHLSDTHLVGDRTLHYGLVDTTAALDAVLTAAGTIGPLDVVVASGDLSDDGTAASYLLLRERLEPFAAARGARVLYAMGNHDDRAGFAEVLGPRCGVTEVGGVRFVVLDSTVPGAGYGLLADEQLGWLAGVLRTPAGNGTVVVLHHPPVPAETPLLRALELQNPRDLAEVLAGSDARLVLAGHYHHVLVDRLAGIPVVVAPGIANTTDVLAPEGWERAHVGAGAALVELTGDDGLRVTPVRARLPEDGRQVFSLGPDEVARIAAVAGP